MPIAADARDSTVATPSHRRGVGLTVHPAPPPSFALCTAPPGDIQSSAAPSSSSSVLSASSQSAKSSSFFSCSSSDSAAPPPAAPPCSSTSFGLPRTWESRRSVANRRATRAEAARGEGTERRATRLSAPKLWTCSQRQTRPGGRERGEGMLREHSFDVNGSFRPLSVESKQCPRRRYRYCSSRGCLQATAECSPDAVQPPSHRHTVTPCFKSGLAFRKNGRSP